MTVDERSRHRGEEYERLLRQERLILDVTERLAEALENSGMTRAELARRLGRTPGFVSQVLGGGRNLTLRTIADMSEALSLRPSFALSQAGHTRNRTLDANLTTRATQPKGAPEDLGHEVLHGSAVDAPDPTHPDGSTRLPSSSPGGFTRSTSPSPGSVVMPDS